MFRWIATLLLCFSHLLTLQARADTPPPFLTEANTPSQPLLELLDIMEVPHHDGTWQSIIQATQKQWIRPKKQERWEIVDINTSQHTEICTLLTQLGLTKSVYPKHSQYHTALVFGATLPAVRERMAFLLQQWNDGIHFSSLVFLCGTRPLNHPSETMESLLNRDNGILPIRDSWSLAGDLPQTEADMMKIVFEQAALPEELRALPAEFVITPFQVSTDGTMRRANTKDTLIQWLTAKPELGSLLFFSNQPFIGYQEAVTRNQLPEDCSFEIVGGEIKSPISIAICLDSLARWIYESQHK